MSLDGDDMLFEAHNTQLDVPIHSGLLPSSRTGSPLVLPLIIIQTEALSIASAEFKTNDIALVVAVQVRCSRRSRKGERRNYYPMGLMLTSCTM